MQATYSPEDNKLRLYALGRLSPDTFERVKKAGFKWAPRQELFVAPAWTPEREDLLLELCGEIGDEDTSLVERAEDRAERFEDYSDKRAADAHQAKAAVEAITDGIPLGQPILVGHHSERRARKDAERIENGMRKAVRMWETAQHWTDRAAGAIRHAKYKERPDVRARRIKGLEADQRKQQRAKEETETRLRLWHNNGQPLTLEQALRIADYNDGGLLLPGGETHWSAWSALKDGKVTPEYVQERRRASLPEVIARCDRWLAHLGNRLAYERAMLGESGGTAADRTKPEKGGACKCWASHRGCWSYVRKVNKVSVTVEDNWGNGVQNFTRTIPFDKLTAILSRADVDAARAAGRLVDTGDGTGFFLKGEPAKAPAPRQEHEPTAFDAMAEALEAGVQVVSAPQLFPTPPDLARRVVELAEIGSGHTVLEPSAGTGALVRAVQEAAEDADITAVEINPQLAAGLSGMIDGARGEIKGKARCGDFLECNGEMGLFDRVVMNPPFANGEDIRHIEHAAQKLKPGGRLVAICANGPRQREKLMPQATAWLDLPPGSFQEAGTNVNAAIVVIDR